MSDLEIDKTALDLEIGNVVSDFKIACTLIQEAFWWCTYIAVGCWRVNPIQNFVWSPGFFFFKSALIAA